MNTHDLLQAALRLLSKTQILVPALALSVAMAGCAIDAQSADGAVDEDLAAETDGFTKDGSDITSSAEAATRADAKERALTPRDRIAHLRHAAQKVDPSSLDERRTGVLEANLPDPAGPRIHDVFDTKLTDLMDLGRVTVIDPATPMLDGVVGIDGE